MHNYELRVGNIGCVLRCQSLVEAKYNYRHYKKQAYNRTGRAEFPVTLLRDREILLEADGRDHVHQVVRWAELHPEECQSIVIFIAKALLLNSDGSYPVDGDVGFSGADFIEAVTDSLHKEGLVKVLDKFKKKLDKENER